MLKANDSNETSMHTATMENEDIEEKDKTQIKKHGDSGLFISMHQ